jgi:hypothetical protein
MRKPSRHRRVSGALMFAILASSTARAADAGMFLCRSSVVANDFWNDLLTAQNTGVKVNRDIAASIAQKNACQLVASSNLKPVNFDRRKGDRMGHATALHPLRR